MDSPKANGPSGDGAEIKPFEVRATNGLFVFLFFFIIVVIIVIVVVIIGEQIAVFFGAFSYFFFLFFIVIVGNAVEMDRMGLRNFEFGLALGATQDFPFFDFVFVDVDFSGTFRAANHGLHPPLKSWQGAPN
jgi:hypothetical protein